MNIESLVNAAANGDTESMDAILAGRPDLLKETLPNGLSPLTAALYYGRQTAVEWLLDKGVSVTIHEAAALGDEETIDYMLGIEPRLLSQVSFDGWTPLHLAAFFGGYEAAKLLLERGADVNARAANEMANMPLHHATAGSRTSMVYLLLERGADPNARMRGGIAPLHQAAERCDAGIVKLLLHYGADADAADDNGYTARRIAEERGHAAILEALQET